MEVKEGYRQTEVGVIPEDWRVFPVTKVTSEIFLGLTSKVDYVTHGGIPLVRATDIADGNLSFSKVRNISIEQHKSLTKYRKAKRGDVLVSKSGSLGVCALVDVDHEFSIYESIIVLQTKPMLHPEFLLWLLRDERTQIRMIGEKVGSSVAHLNIEMFRKLVIQIPTLTEQTAIITAISDAEALIQSMEKLIVKKRSIMQGALQELLKPKVGWVVKKLSEVSEIKRGASPRPINSPIWFDEKSRVSWVRISDVTRSVKFLNRTSQKLSESGIKHSRFVSRNSLIMSICATVGRPILTKIDVCIHDGFVVFANLKIETEYLYYFLISIEKEWSKNGQTGSQMNLNTGIIDSQIITYPIEKLEQTRIATIFSDIDNEIAALEIKLIKYKQIKQGMMQTLLTGRIRLI